MSFQRRSNTCNAVSFPWRRIGGEVVTEPENVYLLFAFQKQKQIVQRRLSVLFSQLIADISLEREATCETPRFCRSHRTVVIRVER